MKKLLLFDVDGTLIDSVGIWNQVDEALIQRIRENGKSEIKNAALQLRRVGKSEGTVNGLKMHKYVIKYRQVVASRCVNSQGEKSSTSLPDCQFIRLLQEFRRNRTIELPRDIHWPAALVFHIACRAEIGICFSTAGHAVRLELADEQQNLAAAEIFLQR